MAEREEERDSSVQKPVPKEEEAQDHGVPRLIDQPMMAWVRGGTSTSENDRRIHEEWADAEKRRDLAAAEKKLCDVPVDSGGGVMYVNNFAEPGTSRLPKANVVFDVVTSRGDPVYDHGVRVQMKVDVVLPDEPAFLAEKMLIMLCIKCKEKGLPLDHCSFRVRQSNKMWHLDERKSGELMPFNDGARIEMVRSAGVVMESEKFRCPQCSQQYWIDKNKLWMA